MIRWARRHPGAWKCWVNKRGRSREGKGRSGDTIPLQTSLPRCQECPPPLARVPTTQDRPRYGSLKLAYIPFIKSTPASRVTALNNWTAYFGQVQTRLLVLINRCCSTLLYSYTHMSFKSLKGAKHPRRTRSYSMLSPKLGVLKQLALHA